MIAWDVGRGEVREPVLGPQRGGLGTGRVVGRADGVQRGIDARAIVWDLSGDRRLDRRFVAGVPFVADDGDGYPIELALSPGRAHTRR